MQIYTAGLYRFETSPTGRRKAVNGTCVRKKWSKFEFKKVK